MPQERPRKMPLFLTQGVHKGKLVKLAPSSMDPRKRMRTIRITEREELREVLRRNLHRDEKDINAALRRVMQMRDREKKKTKH